MNKVILCIILPCVIAMVSSAYIMQNPYAYQTAGQSQQPGQYAAYAANSNQALRQSRLFNYCKYKILFNFNILKFVFWNVLSLTTIFPENINNSEAFYFQVFLFWETLTTLYVFALFDQLQHLCASTLLLLSFSRKSRLQYASYLIPCTIIMVNLYPVFYVVPFV